MPPAQHTRTSRMREIPRAFISNWQCAGAQDAKPLVRRPVTACEACRVAKVKCNRQQGCDRCTSRSISCRYSYTHPQNHHLSQQDPRRISTDASSTLTHSETTPEDVSMDLNIGTADPSCMNNVLYEQVHDNMLDWPQEALSQRVEHFDCSTLNMNQIDQTFDFPSTHPSLTNWGLIQSPTNTTAQNNLAHTTPLSHSDDYNANFMSLSPPSRLSLQCELSAGNACQCRASLMLPIPMVNNAMQEKPEPRLDRVFQVTEDVIRSCQDMIDCSSCQVSCTDLICILAVFQQTSTCFEYIARVDPVAGAFKVSVGKYKVSIANDVKLRRMLVMGLVKSANTILDSSSSLVQNMYPSQPALPCRLSQTNLDYLQQVIKNLKAFLRSIADSFDD